MLKITVYKSSMNVISLWNESQKKLQFIMFTCCACVPWKYNADVSDDIYSCLGEQKHVIECDGNILIMRR